jgi:hypothetical protein
MKCFRLESIIIILAEVTILLLAYFLLRQVTILFIGALIFFFSGYVFSSRKNLLCVSIRFLSSTFIFTVIIFVDVLLQSPTLEHIRFLGFGLAFLIFLIAFTIGLLLKITIKNYDVSTLVFYGLLGILIARVAGFVSHSFSGSIAGFTYFYLGFLLFSKTKLNKFIVAIVLLLYDWSM